MVASAGFSRPFMPDIPRLENFSIRCLHSSAYRTPEAFAGQRVVVVGAANSAVQIAYELAGVAQVELATREKIRFFPGTGFSCLAEIHRVRGHDGRQTLHRAHQRRYRTQTSTRAP